MSSKSKIKGTRWESAVRDYLVSRGFVTVERRTLYGNQDRGDLLGVSGWTLECKDTARLDLPAAIDEAKTEAVNAGTPYFAAIVKRRRKPVSQAYFVLTLEQAVGLIASLGATKPPDAL